jgi:hypothetical protein
MFTGRASKNTTGYIGSRGRICQAITSPITASMTDLMNAGYPRWRAARPGRPESLAPSCRALKGSRSCRQTR